MDSGPETLVPPLEGSEAGSSDESAVGEDNRARVKEIVENFRLQRQGTSRQCSISEAKADWLYPNVVNGYRLRS